MLRGSDSTAPISLGIKAKGQRFSDYAATQEEALRYASRHQTIHNNSISRPVLCMLGTSVISTTVSCFVTVQWSHQHRDRHHFWLC